MDIDIERHMNQAEESRRLNQSTPQPRPHRNPDVELMHWQRRSNLPPDNKYSFKTTFLSSDSHSCKTPFEGLKSINLRDMKVPTVHKGRYLGCQVIGKPSVVVGAEILIKDLNGDVEIVAMYNFYYKRDDLNWLCPGTILIIKEPWLRYGSNNKIPTLRIDSPSDVIVVDPTDDKLLSKIGAKKWFESMSKDAEYWRVKANECFKKADYKNALMLYDRAIRYNPELPVLHLNKSLTCLRMDAFYMAYESAKLALEKGGDREKSLYRMGQAAYGMREWQNAANHFIEVLKEFPKNELASEQLKRTTARLAEQKNGKYDFKKMYLESKKENAELDVSDYKGPIEVTDIPGKGRGIIATKDIKEGALLLISKAFACGYDKDFPAVLFAINLIRKTKDSAAQMLQVVKTIQNLQNNPQKAKEVYALYSGDQKENEEEIPFGVIDAARIQQISAYNRFGSNDQPKDKMAEMMDMFESKKDYSRLFILPSYFNHSCLANSNRIIYGDVMIIRAAADIKKGEEICLSYISPLLDYSVRKEKFEGWKFVCQCKLCDTDAKDKNYSKRAQLVKEYNNFVEASNGSVAAVIAKGEAILKKIRETYVSRKEYKFQMVEMLVTLSQMYYKNGNTIMCMKCLEEVVTILDNPVKYDFKIVDHIVNIAHCCITLNNISKAKEMIQKAFKLSFCADMEHFKMRYPNFAQHLPYLSL